MNSTQNTAAVKVAHMSASRSVVRKGADDSNIGVFLVEDSAVIRDRLIGLLNGIPGVAVMGYAEDADSAVAAILSTQPHAVVLDLQLKGSSGIDVLRSLRNANSGATVIVLTNYATAAYRKRCLESGAQFFLDKTNEFESLPGIFEQLKSAHT
jgi:two-component system, NarL family, response regulator DevR